MGTVLDISQSGILMETVQEVESKKLSLMVTTLNNNLIEISGEVAYCRKAEPGKFKTGIILRGTHDDNVQFVRELIRAYHYQKK